MHEDIRTILGQKTRISNLVEFTMAKIFASISQPRDSCRNVSAVFHGIEKFQTTLPIFSIFSLYKLLHEKCAKKMTNIFFSSKTKSPLRFFKIRRNE